MTTYDQPDAPSGPQPIDRADLENLSAEENTAPTPEIYVGPDDDPPLGPLTLKEAYGEALGAALAWNAAARLAAAASSQSVDDAFVDLAGACPAWIFTFVAPDGSALDLDVTNGQAIPSPDPPTAAAAPFALDELADSPVLVDRARSQGLAGEQFILRLGHSAAGTLLASIQSVESLQQLDLDPTEQPQ